MRWLLDLQHCADMARVQCGQFLLQPNDVVRSAQERQGHEVGEANDVTQVREVLFGERTQVQV